MGFGGPRPVYFVFPLPCPFSPRAPDTRSSVPSTLGVASRRNRADSARPWRLHFPPRGTFQQQLRQECKYGLYRDAAWCSLHSEPWCCRVSVGLVLWAGLPFQKQSQVKYRRALCTVPTGQLCPLHRKCSFIDKKDFHASFQCIFAALSTEVLTF